MLDILKEYLKEMEVEFPLAIQDTVDEMMEKAANNFIKFLS